VSNSGVIGLDATECAALSSIMRDYLDKLDGPYKEEARHFLQRTTFTYKPRSFDIHGRLPNFLNKQNDLISNDISQFEIESNRLKHLMPEYVKEFAIKREGINLPDEKTTNKYDYIKEILSVLGFSEQQIFDEFYDMYNQFSIKGLSIAFLWVHQNYAELDLGCNNKGLICLREILALRSKQKWNRENQQKRFFCKNCV
jgi:hypothetical protein